MKLFVLAFLAFSAAAQAAPTQHLTGFAQANPSCASGYQIYSAGEADGARVVHCLIWSNRVPAPVRDAVESQRGSFLFFGEQFEEGFVVATVKPLGIY